MTTLLAAAGPRRPAAHAGEGLRVSTEQLAAIDGDVLFAYSAARPP